MKVDGGSHYYCCTEKTYRKYSGRKIPRQCPLVLLVRGGWEKVEMIAIKEETTMRSRLFCGYAAQEMK
jgi:hypothetical protein